MPEGRTHRDPRRHDRFGINTLGVWARPNPRCACSDCVEKRAWLLAAADARGSRTPARGRDNADSQHAPAAVGTGVNASLCFGVQPGRNDTGLSAGRNYRSAPGISPRANSSLGVGVGNYVAALSFLAWTGSNSPWEVSRRSGGCVERVEVWELELGPERSIDSLRGLSGPASKSIFSPDGRTGVCIVG